VKSAIRKLPAYLQLAHTFRRGFCNLVIKYILNAERRDFAHGTTVGRVPLRAGAKRDIQAVTIPTSRSLSIADR